MLDNVISITMFSLELSKEARLCKCADLIWWKTTFSSDTLWITCKNPSLEMCKSFIILIFQ